MLRCGSALLQNAGMFDWNDIRSFLAVAESGSTLAAARALRLSQTTVARRITALEAALALTLFERRPAGYALTPDGDALLPAARALARSAEGLGEAATAIRRTQGGVVRVTAPEIYALALIAPLIPMLHASHPEILIELDTTDALRDLDAGAADIALRMVGRPEGAGLVGRRLGDALWGVYCSRGYAAAHGRPTRRRELVDHPFIGGGEEGVWRIYQAWLREHGLEDAVVYRHGSSTGLLSAVRSGLGLAALPCVVADLDAELIRCLPPRPGMDHGLWLLTHERLRTVPRVRIVLDAIATAVSEALAKGEGVGR